MFTSAAKTLLKNHIRHADTHNRMVEESEMWGSHSKLSKIDNHRRQVKTESYRVRGDRSNSTDDKRKRSNQFKGRNDSQDSFLYDRRDDSESPEDRGGAYMDRQQQSERVVSSRDLERSRKSWKTSREQKAGIDRWDHSGFEAQSRMKPIRPELQAERWGHSGYREMYPRDYDSESSGERRKTRKRESYPKWSKTKKFKKRKRKKKKNVSESEEDEDRKKNSEKEQVDEAKVKAEISGLKTNSDLLLMQRFTSEIRPKKPSKPRMKMRTWNSDSSADSCTDSKYHKDKSGKYRKTKTRQKNYRSSESSVDSSSDSCESEANRRKRTKVKKRRKRRHHESETGSDSGENHPSNKKRIRSSRPASSSESAVSAEEYSGKLMSDKKYNRRRNSANSDLTDDSDLDKKMKQDIDSDYSATKKHKKKKKKHKHKQK